MRFSNLKAGTFLGVAILATSFFVACGKKEERHAPVCPYGQVLNYDDAGYSCKYISLTPNTGLVNNAINNDGSLNAPITAGPAGQTLIRWRGNWLCYFSDMIYPSGGDSPQGITPPAGRGGEYCNSVGLINPSVYNPVGVAGYNTYNPASNSVTCPPSFQCIESAAATGTTGNAAVGVNPYSTGGRVGTCQYREGYRGY